MQLKSIKLENIRSYLSQQIDFPEGSVLLSGDIGSGKSSILLSIEFALFGIRKKHLSGNALLRKGKKEGSVELRFEIDKKDVIIKRTLKRGKDKVEQGNGYIVINENKKEATPIELKTEILNLLGYPKELVTKTKDLVYRYTVYTPQEEMKQILTEKEETRLNILRKVFGIARYQRIRENSQVYTRELRDKRKEYQIRISDLEDKQSQKQGLKAKVSEINNKIEELKPELRILKDKIIQSRENVSKSEARIVELVESKKELEFKESDLINKTKQRDEKKKEFELLDKQISELLQEVGDKSADPKSVRIQMKEYEEKIVYLDKRLREANIKLSESKIRRKNSEEVKEKILKLDKCPTCEQNVPREHKGAVSARENERIIQTDKLIVSYEEQIKTTEEDLAKTKEVLTELQKEENKLNIIKVKAVTLEEKKTTKDNIGVMLHQLEKEIDDTKFNIEKLKIKLSEFKDVEKEHLKSKQEFDKINNEENELSTKKRIFETEKQGVKDNIENLTEEIEAKLKIKEKLNYTSQLQNWIDEYFVKVMGTMEKQVLFSVHTEFNELFKTWFNVLMEDETISTRLNTDFTPIIEQNGHDIEIAHLSGGERTAAALAYRLALNKVINDLMTDIKTNDLIILDEPTDGFSSEQLDKVRDVLKQIGVKQIIIVSHEDKIESFVDNVIRINKNEHVSEIA